MGTRTIRYYAVAINGDGDIGQLFVIRKLGRHASATWTGKTYGSMREAAKDMARLNCAYEIEG